MKKFRYELDTTQKLLFIFVMFPFHVGCGSLITSALARMTADLLHLTLNKNMLNVLVNYFFNIIIILIAVYFFSDKLKQQLIELFRDKTPIRVLGVVFVGVIVALALNVAGSILSSIIAGVSSTTNQTEVVKMIKFSRIPMIILGAIIGPAAEEIYFRLGYIGIFSKYGKYVGVVVSSILFGITHVFTSVLAGNFTELYLVIPYVLVGFVFSFVYVKEENVYVSILVHGLMNYLAIAMI